jgi:hypothetical protein
MINNKEIIKEYFTDNSKSKNNNKKIIEHFKLYGWLDNILGFLPFFIYYPIKGFLFLLYKSTQNPLYLLVLFVIFAIIRKVVRSNTHEWAWAYKGE